MILGIDEAGRGPWAGPLIVGAVILGCEIKDITDSKKLSAKRRLELNEEIRARAKAVALGWVSPGEIDALGLAPALTLACKRALEHIDTLDVAYHEIVIDGTVNFLKDTQKGKFVTTMKKADLLVPSVGAASIVAKVARDQYMKEQAKAYPKYGFGAHVGYGTAAHAAAIDKYGVTPLHRLSFAPLTKYRPSFSQPSFSKTASGETRLSETSKIIGNRAETVVAEYLQQNGHTIFERNWRTKFCEIDIVSRKDDTMYFVEVKYRKNDKAGDGMSYITPKKLQQMQFAAKLYAHNKHLNGVNLQLVAVATAGEPPQVTNCVEII